MFLGSTAVLVNRRKQNDIFANDHHNPHEPAPGDIRFIVQGSIFVQTGFAFFEKFTHQNRWEFMAEMPEYIVLVSDPGRPYAAAMELSDAELNDLNTNFPANFPLTQLPQVWEFVWDTNMELRCQHPDQFLYYIKHKRFPGQDHQRPWPGPGEPTKKTLKAVRWGVQVNEWRKGLEHIGDAGEGQGGEGQGVVHAVAYLEVNEVEEE